MVTLKAANNKAVTSVTAVTSKINNTEWKKHDNKNKPKNSIDITLGKDENRDDKVAQVFTKPSVQAALTIQEWEGDLYEFKSLQKALSLQIDEVNNGNMNRPEAMLLAQAHTLDELFNNLARRVRKVQSLKQYELDGWH